MAQSAITRLVWPSMIGTVACAPQIDECESSPCLNGGACRDKVADFECDCLMNFT